MKNSHALLASMLMLASPVLVLAVEIQLNGHTFKLPEGFTIELAAKSPLVDRPITADFDEEGRLYVADSSGTNDPTKKQLEDRPHRIVRLEDANGDGVFDKSVVFADRMMFPEGTMWYAGSLYVAAPPSIWKLTDADGDGVAEKREEWFQGKTLTGCANDLHGPYLGPDGWIYWCKGAFAEQDYTVNGKPWKTKASHIFRCRPDGTGIEAVMTGGMDNPVDTVFMPSGDRIFTTTFLVHPGNGQRDGLIHALYGGVYGKEHGVLDGHPRTGELMPILSHMGAAAPCGLVRAESDAFGEEFRDNVYACQFNLHKLSRHVLTPAGGSYQSKDSDFVVSTNLDFHPTDVIEDADGSLILVDTGGWYKLCCPTSQLHKPDILGAIYRVRRKDAKPVADPRGKSVAWSSATFPELLRLLTDGRPAVRRRAVEALGQKKNDADFNRFVGSALAAIQDRDGTDRRTTPAGWADTAGVRTPLLSVLFAVSRLDSAESRELVRQSLRHWDGGSRQAALHLVSLHRDGEATPVLLKMLQSDSVAERRGAAEALGRIGKAEAVAPLLQAAAEAADRAVDHSITYALIEIADPSATAKGLDNENARVRRAALIAIDQMEGGKLRPDQVTPLLASRDPLLKETANWIVSRHAEWGGELAGWFREQLAGIAPGSKSTDLEAQLTRFAGHPAIQQLLATSVTQSNLSSEARQLVLRAMAASKPKEIPGPWAEEVAKLIAAGEPALLSAAVATARTLPAGKTPHAELTNSLRKVAADPTVAETVRLDAMAAVPGGLVKVEEDQFKLLLSALASDRTVAERSSAADAISKATLTTEQLRQLIKTIQEVGPLELDRLLAAFERSNDEQLGVELIAVLRSAASLSSLRVDSLRTYLKKYGPSVEGPINELHSLVNVDADTQRARLEELLPRMAKGDIRRGQAVFNSEKAACTACHKFGYLGGTTAPDLTRIGQIRTERDLLESILYPSLSFVRSYEPIVIATTDGRVVNGLIKNETADELLLVTGPNQEARVLRSEIETQRPGTISVMPTGLDKQLTEQDLADLVAFLKNAK